MSQQRIEQRHRLRDENLPDDTALIIRGGRDTVDKFRTHATRTARAWSLDGSPLFGISVFAVLDTPLEELLRRRFATFRWIYLPTAGELRGAGFHLLPTGQHPHFTVHLTSGDDVELGRLLVSLGSPRDNPEYGNHAIWREEG